MESGGYEQIPDSAFSAELCNDEPGRHVGIPFGLYVWKHRRPWGHRRYVSCVVDGFAASMAAVILESPL